MIQESLVGVGRAHGTFGELLQGALPGEDRDFLITFPLKLYATVRVQLSPALRGVSVYPPRKRKVWRLAQRLLQDLAPQMGAEIHVDSELPVGKGFASSSADLVATARALAGALSCELSDEHLFSRLRSIEPTDGVMYPAFVAFFHRRVALLRSLGLPLRPLRVLCLDQGGEVDTLEFNQHLRAYPPSERLIYEWLLKQAEEAFRTNDLASLGDVATQSALLHQHRLPKAHLATCLRIRSEIRALGVAVTHSGPCVGLILDSEDLDGARWATQRLEALGFQVRAYHSLCAADGVAGTDARRPAASGSDGAMPILG